MKTKTDYADVVRICYAGHQELIVNQVSREDHFLTIPDDVALLILKEGQNLATQDRSIDLRYSSVHSRATFGVIYLKLGDDVVIRAFNAVYCISRSLNGWLVQEKVCHETLGCCCESGDGKWFYCATKGLWTQHYPTNDACPICGELMNMRNGDKHGSRVMEGEYSQSPVSVGC